MSNMTMPLETVSALKCGRSGSVENGLRVNSYRDGLMMALFLMREDSIFDFLISIIVAFS